jgi:hypothetical protein
MNKLKSWTNLILLVCLIATSILFVSEYEYYLNGPFKASTIVWQGQNVTSYMVCSTNSNPAPLQPSEACSNRDITILPAVWVFGVGAVFFAIALTLSIIVDWSILLNPPVCPNCNGFGYTRSKCSICKGTGKRR